jgi:DnaJ-class molecular chaperone
MLTSCEIHTDLKCKLCDGDGYIRDVKIGLFVNSSKPVTCPICKGSGLRPNAKCPHCGETLS